MGSRRSGWLPPSGALMVERGGARLLTEGHMDILTFTRKIRDRAVDWELEFRYKHPEEAKQSPKPGTWFELFKDWIEEKIKDDKL